MSKLVYCSYNLIDQDGIPDWVEKFIANPVVQKDRWSIYNPIHGFTAHIEGKLSMTAALADAVIPKEIQRSHKILKLDPMLFAPLSEVLPRLRAADESPTLDVAFKSLYVILRSDVMLVDLNEAGHGESAQEVLYAYLCNIPVIGIAHRFILSPWMLNKLNAVIFPRTTDEIVQQVLAYDHKTTAMLDHYRAEHEEKKKQDARAEARAERLNKPRRTEQRTTGKAILPSQDTGVASAPADETIVAGDPPGSIKDGVGGTVGAPDPSITSSSASNPDVSSDGEPSSNTV